MSRLFADLSNNDPQFTASKYRNAGHILLGFKATQGLEFTDAHHAAACEKAHKVNIAIAHYHFAEPNHDAVKQARHFWHVVKPQWRTGDYVVLDVERLTPSRKNRDLRAWCNAFQRELHRVSGHDAILYTYLSFLTDNLGPLVRRRFPRIWMAQYSHHATPPMWARPLWAWQRTDGKDGPAPHTLPGIPHPCDVNVLNERSYKRLRALLG